MIAVNLWHIGGGWLLGIAIVCLFFYGAGTANRRERR